MKILVTVLAVVAIAMAEKDENTLLEDANNQFTAKMFSEVVKSNPGKSVVISAFSVLPPLAQLGLASEGESHNEILRTIGMPDYNSTTRVFSQLNQRLLSVKGVELKMANRIYVRNGGQLNEEFAQVSRDVFASDVKNVDFSKSTDAAKEINTWVEDHTNNRIKDLVDPNSLSGSTSAVLVNAIYFKGIWKDQFDELETKERDFHVTKEKTIKLPTMHRRGNYKYGESTELNAKLLELPYEGYEASLLVILPNEIDGIAELETKLKDPTAISRATKEMYTYEVDVFLPKFKIETTTNLKDVLGNIGVTKLFSDDAQINKLLKNEKGLHVDSATQKAFIEVNEKGAEAAAANEFGIAYLSAVIYDTRQFKVDRPFVYLLEEGPTTLFSGVFHA